ncbi:MAG TPA: DUF4430 domain-containing protein [Lachnospiraceae bacterium]|nr:DUF4430 domain-containing protein [Lachnospiraceae bacterium]
MENKEMETTKEKKGGAGKAILGIVIAVVLIGALIAVYLVFGPKTSEGSKAITITITDDQGVDTVYETKTDAEYLMDAVQELDGITIEGEEGDYGLFIKTVNGITADYDTDGAYWSIYVNGEYGNYGIDAQPVADGDSYAIVYEVYTE